MGLPENSQYLREDVKIITIFNTGKDSAKYIFYIHICIILIQVIYLTTNQHVI